MEGLRQVAVVRPESMYRKQVRVLRVPAMVILKLSVRECCRGSSMSSAPARHASYVEALSAATGACDVLGVLSSEALCCALPMLAEH